MTPSIDPGGVLFLIHIEVFSVVPWLLIELVFSMSTCKYVRAYMQSDVALGNA